MASIRSPFPRRRTRIRGAIATSFMVLTACPLCAQEPANPWEADGAVSLKFPNNPVSDILDVYQRLSGKVVIKDSRVFDGESLSLVTEQDVTPEEALRLMEGALQINGYILSEGDDGRSVRVMLKDADQATMSEGMTIHRSLGELPGGGTLVGYFMALKFLDPTEAGSIFANHIGLNPFGRITPVANPPGLIITESSSIIRRLEQLRTVIDIPHGEGERITDFFDLVHAEASIVAQIIQATLATRGPGAAVGRNTLTDSSPRATARSEEETPPQVVPDDRLNRIMVVARPDEFTYISSLIDQFDQPIPIGETLERRLRYVFVDEVLPVLADVLQDTGTGTTPLPGGGSITTREQPQASVQASTLTGRTRRGAQMRDVSEADPGGRADQLLEPLESNAPISVQVGKTRIIADLQANAIIAVGPRDSLNKLDDILDRLDRKPPQVYLATIIGQLDLGDGLDLGVEWLQQFEKTGDGGYASSFLTRPGLLNAVGDMRENILTETVSPLSGLNFYGQISDNVEVFIRALERSNRFKILSRPAVYAANNKKAVITSGQEVPVPTSSITDLSNTDNVRTNIDFRDVVLKLEVIPLINDNDEVTLTIAQVNDTVIGMTEVGGDQVPIIGTDRLTTTVTIPNRMTVVLGGLITETEEEDSQGIPFVSRIPVLGHAFKTSGTRKSRKELLIFIQPVVVESERELGEASYYEDLRTGIGADAYQRFPDHPDPREAWPPEDPVATGLGEESAGETGGDKAGGLSGGGSGLPPGESLEPVASQRPLQGGGDSEDRRNRRVKRAIRPDRH